MNAKSIAVPQIIAQHRQILRGGNDEDLAQASEHQCSQWIANHRLVVDRQQLLADDLCDRIQPSSGATREQNGLFHFGFRMLHRNFTRTFAVPSAGPLFTAASVLVGTKVESFDRYSFRNSRCSCNPTVRCSMLSVGR